MNKLFGLDQKSQIKTNNYSFFFSVKWCTKHAKMAQKWPKMSQNAHYFTVFNSIQHYFTLKKVLVLHAKQIG